jgi:rhamnosyltransferase
MMVDNHSDNFAAFSTWTSSLNGCIQIASLASNLGQAAAINHAFGLLTERNYPLALLFDQDSAVGGDFVSGMLQAWNGAQALAPNRVAAIGPRLVDPRNGQKMPFRLFQRLFDLQVSDAIKEPSLFESAFLITSGCLISLNAVRDLGPMRTDYFIDNVDLEWCFRARHHGYRLFGTDHVTMSHHIGEDGDSFWVRKGFVVQHSALRYYYSTRNRLHLHRQAHAPWVWRVKDMVRFAIKTTYLLAFSSARKDYWHQLKRAIHDTRHLI